MKVDVPLPVDPEGIPEELRDRPQWVTWRLVQRAGQLKPTKVLINPSTGQSASTIDPSTWTSFDEAISVHSAGQGDGVGFVFSPDGPYTGIDLDGCYDPETKVMADWAQDIVDKFSSYTELSPSGQGIDLSIRGNLPGKGRRKGSGEMYSEARFFTMTGAQMDGCPAQITERSMELHTICEEVFGEVKQDRAKPSERHPIHNDDDVLIKKACRAKNGANFSKLWQGDWSGYPSQSEADLALCSMLGFCTDGDIERVNRLFRRSGLFRPKWDEQRGEQTKGQMTISKAVEHPGSNYHLQPKLRTAECFAELYGHGLRYDHARNRWLLWEGHRWTPDCDGEVNRLAKESARQRYLAAADIRTRTKRARLPNTH